MKKTLLAISLLSSIIGSLSAGTMGPVVVDSPNYFYLELFSGYSFPFNESLIISTPSDPSHITSDLSGSVLFGGEVGYRFTDYFRGGIEVAYRPDFLLESYDPAEALAVRNLGVTPNKSLSAMVNGYLSANSYDGFTPYITGGIGIASTRHGDVNAYHQATNTPVFFQPKGRKTVFSWQAGAGATYDVTSNFALDLRGRVIDFGKTQSAGTGVFRPVGSALSFSSSDFNEFKFKAFELSLGVVLKAD